MSRLCECGCGEPVNTIRKDRPRRFLPHHHMRTKFGETHPSWRGGRTITTKGYTKVKDIDHPRADVRGYVPEHVLVVERALGKSLPFGIVVHHVNGAKNDNRPANLVVCQDETYHRLLHRRQRALRACGNPSWRKCWACRQWDDPNNLHIRRSTVYHDACVAAKERQKRKAARVA